MQKNDVKPVCQHLVQTFNSGEHYFEEFLESIQNATSSLRVALHAEYHQKKCECEICSEAIELCCCLSETIPSMYCYLPPCEIPRQAGNAVSVTSAIAILRLLGELPKKLSENVALASALNDMQEANDALLREIKAFNPNQSVSLTESKS